MGYASRKMHVYAEVGISFRFLPTSSLLRKIADRFRKAHRCGTLINVCVWRDAWQPSVRFATLWL